MKLLCVVLLALPAIFCAPAPAQSGSDLQNQLSALQQQLVALQQQIEQQKTAAASPKVAEQQKYVLPQKFEQSNGEEFVIPDVDEQKAYMLEPLRKRLVYWQPMKRDETVKSADREAVLRAVEERLSEVIRAASYLGITSDELLAHLKMRNSSPQ